MDGLSESWDCSIRIYLFQMLEVKTDGEAPEGQVRNVRVLSVTSNEIQVTWDHPSEEPELLGYYVGYKRYRYFPFRGDAPYVRFEIANWE